ncbi:MAG: TIGR00282 family metallophosphoesterase [Lactobacillus sp.]|jgi:metallophosphoesterase (TIGR00282 family)|nr:TIGR00282 family metallophosphoesterase [Lactobacillus sp.]
MRIFYCGDVVGRAGRDAVIDNIEHVKATYKPDVFIVNIENAAHGFGVTPGIAREFFDKGIDVLTLGNHTWKQREISPFMDQNKRLVRPLNYPEGLPGHGYCEYELANGKRILVTQVLGRLFMDPIDNPAIALDKLLSRYILGKNIDAIFVDVHAEATAEKLAIGHYMDGKVSVVAGSHTHVPTADACIRDKGTAYITDVGMCGNYNSVLGFEIDEPINRVRQKYTGGRLVVCRDNGTMFGICVETDDKTGLATKIEQVRV